MKLLIKTTILITLIYGCNNAPTETRINESKPLVKDSVLAKKDAPEAIIANEDTIPLPPEHYTKKGYEIGFELMDSEKLGDIWIGMPKEQVVKLLGQPESKTDTSIDQTSGALYQGWTYKKKGIMLAMEGENYSKQKISGITIMAPCTYKLKRRVGIGSTAQEIKKAYPKALNREESTSHCILLGSFYGGIWFTMHNNKADTLVIGASAE